MGQEHSLSRAREAMFIAKFFQKIKFSRKIDFSCTRSKPPLYLFILIINFNFGKIGFYWSNTRHLYGYRFARFAQERRSRARGALLQIARPCEYNSFGLRCSVEFLSRGFSFRAARFLMSRGSKSADNSIFRGF